MSEHNDDTQGNSVKVKFVGPVGVDDTEANSFRGHVTDAGSEDTEGNVRSRVNDAGTEDTEGNTIHGKGAITDAGEDVEVNTGRAHIGITDAGAEDTEAHHLNSGHIVTNAGSDETEGHSHRMIEPEGVDTEEGV